VLPDPRRPVRLDLDPGLLPHLAAQPVLDPFVEFDTPPGSCRAPLFIVSLVPGLVLTGCIGVLGGPDPASSIAMLVDLRSVSGRLS
jgi:hypothetical protein